MSDRPRFGKKAEFTGPLPASLIPRATIEAGSSANITRLRLSCLEKIDPNSAAVLNQDQLMDAMILVVAERAEELRIAVNAEEQRLVAEDLVSDMTGLGPLQPLVDDESISDIMVNGASSVFVERNGLLLKIDVRFRDNQHLLNICQRIASTVGRRVDESSPMVDARLKDGSRVNIIIPPVALDGPALSIRKFRANPIDLSMMVNYGSMSDSVATLLKIIARCRLNVIISGGTGSGKTTLLNAMSQFVDDSERIVTVEDAAELQLQKPHVVRLETRPLNLEGKGEITQRDLVRNALRMRPDRIIIGEVRGGEAFDMLQAMNTGHDGSMSTVHANNARDAIARVENMVQMANTGLENSAVRRQIVSAVHVIVQIQRQRDGKRRLSELVEIAGSEAGTPLLNTIAAFVPDADATGDVKGRYKVTPSGNSFQEKLQYYGQERAWKQALEQAARS